MAKKSNKRPERISGGYLSIPWAVFDSVAFKGSTAAARSLMIALARQANGFNNGHLQMTQSWMKEMGYTNLQQNKNARDELIERGLIVYTRRGGLNMGADNFAITWLDISNFSGLDITFREYEKGKYLSCDLPPTPRRKQPKKNTPFAKRINHDSVIVSGIEQ